MFVVLLYLLFFVFSVLYFTVIATVFLIEKIIFKCKYKIMNNITCNIIITNKLKISNNEKIKKLLNYFTLFNIKLNYIIFYCLK